MSWRTLLSVCAGLLLPLPLVVLLGMLLQPEQALEAETGARISPMLDGEQRMQLVTYRRDCETGAECEPPLGCLFSFRYGHAYCTDSECLTDAQCPEGQVCLKLATKESGPLVRQCIAVGMRQEGENCYRVPEDQKGACAGGLVCAGKDAWCARPCQLDVPEECPEGFFCADTTPKPACLPTCEKRSCPAGQQCIQFREGSSQCMQVYGTNCQQATCAEGEFCSQHITPTQPGKVWMRCLPRCAKDEPRCAPGLVCDAYACLPACNPQGPETCAEGYRCRQPRPEWPLACRPDW
jgi:Cys-rich repeat protein